VAPQSILAQRRAYIRRLVRSNRHGSGRMGTHQLKLCVVLSVIHHPQIWAQGRSLCRARTIRQGHGNEPHKYIQRRCSVTSQQRDGRWTSCLKPRECGPWLDLSEHHSSIKSQCHRCIDHRQVISELSWRNSDVVRCSEACGCHCYHGLLRCQSASSSAASVPAALLDSESNDASSQHSGWLSSLA